MQARLKRWIAVRKLIDALYGFILGALVGQAVLYKPIEFITAEQFLLATGIGGVAFGIVRIISYFNDKVYHNAR